MRLKLIGLSHRTAPINIREQVTIQEDLLREANRLYRDSVSAEETMLLSTCNRVEAYLFGPDGEAALGSTMDFLRNFSRAPIPGLDRYTYHLEGEEAVRHLFRVASGLDSMVLGEAQVTGQLKTAYRIARQEQTAGKQFNRLLSYAFFTAKKVRTVTRISELPVSISSVAVELAHKIFEDLSRRQVLLIGAGKMSRLAVKGFLSAGVRGLTVVNRTREKATVISEELGGLVRDYEKLEECMAESDIVIASTGAREYIIAPEMMERVIRQRRNQPLFIIDIAVPRNVDPAINRIDNVFLYDIDNLDSVISDHRDSRSAEAVAAEEIVRENVRNFLDFRQREDIGPLVRELRRKVEEICLEELEISRRDMEPAEYEEMKRLMFRTVNRLSHPLIQQIKASSADLPDMVQNREILEVLVREAFKLKEDE